MLCARIAACILLLIAEAPVLPTRALNLASTNHSRIVYGYVHMAKVAGTNLNGELSMHFERVCGNKGNSYDAFQHNLRVNSSGMTSVLGRTNFKDIYGHKSGGFNSRGSFGQDNLLEIGIENCDFIANEGGWPFWTAVAATLGAHQRRLELHVPCRDPVDHLMSMCNFHGNEFDCSLRDSDLFKNIDRCLLFMSRFGDGLKRVRNIDLRCFDNALTFSEYLPFMSKRLQRKKIEASYVYRTSNEERKRAMECIWDDANSQVRHDINSNYCH